MLDGGHPLRPRLASQIELNKELSCHQCCFACTSMILIKTLRKKKTGCWINNSFVGIIVYADDIVLLNPSIDGLQEMIDTCSDFAGNTQSLL